MFVTIHLSFLRSKISLKFSIVLYFSLFVWPITLKLPPHFRKSYIKNLKFFFFFFFFCSLAVVLNFFIYAPIVHTCFRKFFNNLTLTYYFNHLPPPPKKEKFVLRYLSHIKKKNLHNNLVFIYSFNKIIASVLYAYFEDKKKLKKLNY